MFEWIANVLFAALLAFGLNSVYQAKRELRRSGATLYAAIQNYAADRDLFTSGIAQAASGLVSYSRVVRHFSETGVPDSRVISELIIVVNTDFPELEDRLNETLQAGKRIHTISEEFAVLCKQERKEHEEFMSSDHCNMIIAAKEDFDDVINGFKDHVKKEKMSVTWLKALKDVFSP